MHKVTASVGHPLPSLPILEWTAGEAADPSQCVAAHKGGRDTDEILLFEEAGVEIPHDGSIAVATADLVAVSVNHVGPGPLHCLPDRGQVIRMPEVIIVEQGQRPATR